MTIEQICLPARILYCTSTKKNRLKVCWPGAFGVADTPTSGEEDEEEPTRNWRPPRGDNDYGALAGEHERAALAALGFGMKLRGKDIAVGNGIKTNGFLEADVFRMWGVQNYAAIWGSSGKAVTEARGVKARGQDSKLSTCVGELEQPSESAH